MADPAPLPYIDPGQQVLPGLGPMVGERWRNRNTGTIATVLGIECRRYGWVTIRTAGTVQPVRIATFFKFFERI